VDSRRTAKLAGALYLALIPFGIFSFAYVPSVLFVRGDSEATAQNILASERLFRAATVSHLVSQILVVVLALVMYRLFESVNRNRALLLAALALLGVPVSFVNEVSNLAALRALGGEGDTALAMLFLDMSRNGIFVAQVFWGLWLVTLASLVLEARFLPRLLALPAAIAGVAYLFDSFRQLLFPGGGTISQFTFVGELLLPLWLLSGRRRDA
jgi:hypothetical protein